MNSTVFRISLDIHEVNSQVTLRVKKGDSARQILIALTEGGRPYKISEDCMAVFTAKKPDETILYNGCEIQGNRILYAMTPQTCTVVGAMKCEIRVYGTGGALITSPRFTILVDDTVYSDDDVVDSSSEFSALTDLMAKAQQIIAEYEAWLENAEDYATQDELQKLQTLVGEEEYLTLLEAVSVLDAVYGLRENLTELGKEQNVIGKNASDAIAQAKQASDTANSAVVVADSANNTAVNALYIAQVAHDNSVTAVEEAEEARLIAEDAEQAAITAISMGNHIIRASTADGVSYVAPKSDTLPAIATGTAGGHTGKGTRIVFIPSWPNTAASPTLKIGDGEAIPIRLRSAANKGDNDQAPDATDDIPIGALMAGVPYAMTFCGKCWLIDSLIGRIGGGKIYVSDTMPEGLKPGDAWVNTGEELAAPITQGQMETYVNTAIQTALAAITIAEEGAY